MAMRHRRLAFSALLAASIPLGSGFAAEADPGRVYNVVANLHVAVVEDRNTPFLVGNDAVLLAETNFERNAETVSRLIASVTDKPVRVVVNSHWHPDHVGGNSHFAGLGATTVAHENTRLRMREQQLNQTTGEVQSQAFVSGYLPMLTFDDEMTVHWDEMTVDLIFYPDAHTDSDVAMYYRDLNVVYLGGLLNYPTYAGVYRVPGYLAALDAIVAETNQETKFIPWRGPVIDRAEVQEWRNLLATVAERVQEQVSAGESLEEVLASQPSREFDAKWGGGQRTPDRFVNDIYAALTAGAE
jgi:cyclase